LLKTVYKKMDMKKLSLFSLLILVTHFVVAQVTVNNTTMTVEQFVQNVLIGNGVTISNVQFNGGVANVVNAQVGSFQDVNSDVGLSSGLILGSGSVSMAAQLNTSGSSSLGGLTGVGSDPDLAGITPNTIYDECVIEFDFVPSGDTISFNYVFASEEYDEYACGTVNDAFGFFLTGTNPLGGNYAAYNIALIPDPSNISNYTTTPVSINTVNLGVAGSNGTLANCTSIDPNFATYNVFYTQNTTNTYEYDGKTVVLKAVAAVNCGETYHIKLAIGDGGDGSYDSGVFLEGGSFSSSVVEVNVVTATGDSNIIEGCDSAILNLTRPDTSGSYTVHFDITGTAINGVDYNFIADSVIFNPGQGTVSLGIIPIADGNSEGQEVVTITVYTINPCGDTITSVGHIYILDLPNMQTHTSDTTIKCPSSSVRIGASATGASPPFSYVWTDKLGNNLGNTDQINVAVNATDTFYVSITDSCNLVTIIDSVIVNLNVVPLGLTVSPDTNICPGHNISIGAQGAGGVTPYSYIWNNGASTSNISISPNTNTMYYITLTDSCNTTSLVDSVYITTVFPPLTLAVSNDTNVCAGDSVILQAQVGGGLPNYSYLWSPGGSSNASLKVATLTTAIWTVTITDFCGVTNLIDSVEVNTDYDSMIVENITWDEVCMDDTVNFEAIVSGGQPPYQYLWSYGNTQQNGNPVSFVAILGNINVSNVVITDACNVSKTENYVLLVKSCQVESPNIFTPNGDKINDFLIFKGLEDFPNNRLQIYNRWGDLIYEKDTYQNEWDGQGFPEGTYFYILQLNDVKSTIEKGTLTIVR
jgi:gliding motility-associated-like protein